jgi:hypothetical protein
MRPTALEEIALLTVNLYVVPYHATAPVRTLLLGECQAVTFSCVQAQNFAAVNFHYSARIRALVLLTDSQLDDIPPSNNNLFSALPHPPRDDEG